MIYFLSMNSVADVNIKYYVQFEEQKEIAVKIFKA